MLPTIKLFIRVTRSQYLYRDVNVTCIQALVCYLQSHYLYRRLNVPTYGFSRTTTHPWVVRVQQPWVAFSLEEGQFRFETHERQVCLAASTCENLGSRNMSVHPETVPQPWVNCPLAPEAWRTLRQKTYSFVVATAILAC